MLVLTRSAQEEIRIGDDIVIRVLDVKGDRVRIGIAAPSEVPVHRQEVYLEIERANRAALSVAGSGLKGARKLLDKKNSGGQEGRTSSKGPRARVAAPEVSTEVSHGA
ncbi:MAG: carbon storage regulator CsrA [Planctomycetota bacterium]